MLTLKGSYGKDRDVIQFSSDDKLCFAFYRARRKKYDMRLSFDDENYTLKRCGCWTIWYTVRKYSAIENLYRIKRTTRQAMMAMFEFVLHDGTVIRLTEKAGFSINTWELKYNGGVHGAKFVFKDMSFDRAKSSIITIQSMDHPQWKLIVGFAWFICYNTILTRLRY